MANELSDNVILQILNHQNDDLSELKSSSATLTACIKNISNDIKEFKVDLNKLAQEVYIGNGHPSLKSRVEALETANVTKKEKAYSKLEDKRWRIGTIIAFVTMIAIIWSIPFWSTVFSHPDRSTTTISHQVR